MEINISSNKTRIGKSALRNVILKNVVGRVSRSKLEEHCLDKAFKSGMDSEKINIEDIEISSTWRMDSSSETSVRQMQMLGYWSLTNCPTFKKIFFGEKCVPREENVVVLTSKSGRKAMTSDEVDKLISPKMECTAVELTISESTIAILKHFVQVPVNLIETSVAVPLSQRMKSYNIKDIHIAKCWAALKHGEWVDGDSIQVNTDCLVDTSHQSRQTTKIADTKRVITPSNLSEHSSSRNGAVTTFLSKRARMDTVTNNSHCDGSLLNLTMKPSFSNEMTEAEVPLDLSVKIVSESQKQSEGCDNGSQSMAEVRETLRLEIEHLNRHLQLILTTEFEKVNQTLRLELSPIKKSFIEIDNLNRTNRELQSQLAECEAELQQKRTSLSKTEQHIDALQSELAGKNTMAAEIENLNCTNRQLQLQLTECEAEIQQKCTSLSKTEQHIDELQSELAEKNTMAAEIDNLNRTNRELQSQLAECEGEIQQKRTSLSKTEQHIDALQSELAGKNTMAAEIENLNCTNRQLQLQLTECEAEIQQKCIALSKTEQHIDELQSELAEKNTMAAEIDNLNRTNRELQLQLTECEAEIQQKCTSLSKTEQHIDELQSELAEKNTMAAEIDNLNRTNRELQSQLAECEGEIQQKCTSLFKTEQHIDALQSELAEKDTMAAEIENLNRTNRQLQLQLAEREADIQQKCTLLAKTEQHVAVVQSELAEKNTMAVETENSNHTKLNLNLQMDDWVVRKTAMVAEMENLNQNLHRSLTENKKLHLELISKNEAIKELENFKIEMEQSIIHLESELNGDIRIADLQSHLNQKEESLLRKTESLAETEKDNLNLRESLAETKKEVLELQSEIGRKNAKATELENLNRYLQYRLAEVEIELIQKETSPLELAVHSEQTSQPSQTEVFERKSLSSQASQTEEFYTDDPIVRLCRPKLMTLEFGWVKFTAKDKFRPGFKHIDEDGSVRAQLVTCDGYVSDVISSYDTFLNDIPEHKKQPAQLKKLKLFNKKFQLSFK